MAWQSFLVVYQYNHNAHEPLWDCRDKLRQAANLIEGVRVVFIMGGCVEGARLLNDVAGLISDEIAALDKTIGQGQQP
jgi:hypothetical protein